MGRTVNDIFRLAVQNGNQTNFHAFPHILAKAMARKTTIEEILKRLQSINKQIRYQIRLGKTDIELFMKNHEEYKWKPFRKVDIKMIDPNEEVAEWDLTKKKENVFSRGANPFDITKQPGKRGATESPENRKTKRSNIDDWQVCEFVWAYLEGTKTQPEYKNITWETEGDLMGSQRVTIENDVPADVVTDEAEDQSGDQTED